MKKMKKGFTLVELLVVIGILGMLMGVFYPMISSAMTESSMKTAGVAGKRIVDEILKGSIDRQANGLPSLWPKEAEGKSDDTTDIAGNTFGTSTKYFEMLFDIPNQTKGQGQWRPFTGTRNYEASWLALSGVPPHQPGVVEQKNVAWTIVSGIQDELPDYLPALVTRNGDTAQFATSGQFDSSTKGNDLITMGKKFPSPFGNNGIVIVTKSGAVKNLKPRECNLRDVYGRNNLFLPDGIQLKYLEP